MSGQAPPPLGYAHYVFYPNCQHVPPQLRAFIEFPAETYGPKPSWEKKLRAKLRWVSLSMTQM